MRVKYKTLMPTKKWQDIDWRRANTHVRKLQLNIVKALKEKDYTKVRLAQEQLVRSYSARALAVRSVTSNTQITHSKNPILIAAWKKEGLTAKS